MPTKKPNSAQNTSSDNSSSTSPPPADQEQQILDQAIGQLPSAKTPDSSDSLSAPDDSLSTSSQAPPSSPQSSSSPSPTPDTPSSATVIAETPSLSAADLPSLKDEDSDLPPTDSASSSAPPLPTTPLETPADPSVPSSSPGPQPHPQDSPLPDSSPPSSSDKPPQPPPESPTLKDQDKPQKKPSLLKSPLLILAITIGTLAFCAIAILTVIKLRQLATTPVAPTAPESHPAAAEEESCSQIYEYTLTYHTASSPDCNAVNPGGDWQLYETRCLYSDDSCYGQVCLWEKPSETKYEYKITNENSTTPNCSDDPPEGYTLERHIPAIAHKSGTVTSDLCLWKKTYEGAIRGRLHLGHVGSAGDIYQSQRCATAQSQYNYPADSSSLYQDKWLFNSQVCIGHADTCQPNKGCTHLCVTDLTLWEEICAASPTPTPTSGQPLCEDLSRDLDSPEVGSNLTYTCTRGSFSAEEPVAYFRYRVGEGDWSAEIIGSPVGDQPATDFTTQIEVSQAGTWQVECQICTDSGKSSCTEWGEAQ